jgi:hypothetical protein
MIQIIVGFFLWTRQRTFNPLEITDIFERLLQHIEGPIPQ